MKVKFHAACRWATPHSDEAQVEIAAGEVVDLAKITRSPGRMAEIVISNGRGVEVQDSEDQPEAGPSGQGHAGSQTGAQDDGLSATAIVQGKIEAPAEGDKETKPRQFGRKAKQGSVLD